MVHFIILTKTKQQKQTNKNVRLLWYRSLNLKSPFPTGYLKSGVPTIKPFLRQESGSFNSYKWMYKRQYGLSLFSLNVIAGISNVYIVSHHSKGMFINKNWSFLLFLNCLLILIFSISPSLELDSDKITEHRPILLNWKHWSS